MLDRAREILAHDLDADFVKMAAIELGWQYADSFNRLSSFAQHMPGLGEEEFSRQRGLIATAALTQVAKTFNVPYEMKRLVCNGQHKLIVKMGRLVIIQEPILAIGECPKIADYKQELARAYGGMQQLELDLGDRPFHLTDISNSMLCVLLHGSAGPKFNETDKRLGSLMLAVPDNQYSSWLMRIDLQKVAQLGVVQDGNDAKKPYIQEDRVVVTPKRKQASRDSSQ